MVILILIFVVFVILAFIRNYNKNETNLDKEIIQTLDNKIGGTSFDKRIGYTFLEYVTPVQLLDAVVQTVRSEKKPLDETILHFFTRFSAMGFANKLCKQRNMREYRDNCVEILQRIRNNSYLSNLFISHYLMFQKGILVFELKNNIILTQVRYFPNNKDTILEDITDAINEWKYGIVK